MTWMTNLVDTDPSNPIALDTGVGTSNSMQVCIQVGSTTLHALDSSSMHNLIFKEATTCTNL